MSPETQLAELKTILNEYTDLISTLGLLHWDLETYMPPGGSQGHGHQMATITRIAQKNSPRTRWDNCSKISLRTQMSSTRIRMMRA
jgi:Zn-dependent M32 family carboxypeptidase